MQIIIQNLPVESLKQGRNDRGKYAWNYLRKLTLTPSPSLLCKKENTKATGIHLLRRIKIH